MTKKSPSLHTAKWFFIIVSVAVVYLFWKIIQPFALVLIMSVVATVMFAPVDRKLREVVKSPKLSAFIVIFGVFVLIVLPLIGIGLAVAQQAGDLVNAAIENREFLATLNPTELPFFDLLPTFVQEWAFSLNIADFGLQAAGWVVQNISTVIAQTAQFVFHTLIFFIAFFYLLVDRQRLNKLVLELSPFKDSLDKQIIQRIKTTIRGVVFGAIVVAIIQGIVATIGLTIFGVPGAILWGSLVVIATQIPLIGTALIMIPAVIYLWISGSPGAAIGLLIWAVAAVGMIENILSPYLVSGKTKMHGLLILLSILGGIQAFGPVGFIVGPTILAGLMVLVDLYRDGILEKYAKVV